MTLIDPATTSQYAIRIEQVACRIGKRLVLDGIDLDIPTGEITGILGPNGAGKSTLLNIIIGLRKPSAGRVSVLGQPQSHRNAEMSQRIGVVLQETALYDELSAFENLRFTASLSTELPIPGRVFRKCSISWICRSVRTNEWAGSPAASDDALPLHERCSTLRICS